MHNILIRPGTNAYNIYIEHGVINKLAMLLPQSFVGSTVVIITDDNVGKLHLQKLTSILSNSGYITKTISVPSGEQSKSISQLEHVYNQLATLDVNRSNLIIAFGGGVVGDLAGFVASTYLRGISYIQIPTTLLAQVDSSIGGKVAVNLNSGKNLVGSFYHPECVFIDPDFLSALPKKQYSNGIAEVIKYGAIKDKVLFDILLNINSFSELEKNIEQIIVKCVTIKKEIVEKDEKDTGERMLLNFGHTLGHVIENYFNYNTYTHGEAIAIGMCTITKYTEQMNLTSVPSYSKLIEICKMYQLPFEVPKMDIYKINDIIKLDKKFTDKDANLVILSEIGDAFIHKISSKQVLSYFGL